MATLEAVRRGQKVGRNYFCFAGAQIAVGLALSQFHFGDFAWAKRLFAAIDPHLPAFATMFQLAPDPTGSKILLLIWWLVFLPVGLGYCWRVMPVGFKPHVDFLRRGRLKILGYAVLGGGFTWVIVWVHAFRVYTFEIESGQYVQSRADIIPWLLAHGPTATAVWLAAVSILAIICPCLFLASTRALLFDYAEIKKLELTRK
ncbi:MAG: hypothetical protein ACOY95_11575 [Pseudomonadota bacterium]